MVDQNGADMLKVHVEASGSDSWVDFGLVKLWREQKSALSVYPNPGLFGLDILVALHCEPSDNWTFP